MPVRRIVPALLAPVIILPALLTPGCGRKAAPQPPIVRVAERTRDLVVSQVGTEAVLTWSYPSMTRSGGPLPDLESVEVWRLSLPPSREPHGASLRLREVRVQLLLAKGRRVARLHGADLQRATRGPKLVYRDDLATWYRKNHDRMPLIIWYAVRSICCHGHASELSNIVRLRPQAPPSPPSGVTAKARAAGITLSWTPSGANAVIVERSRNGKAWHTLTPKPIVKPPWQDASAAQGVTWIYRLRSLKTVGGVRIVGEPSTPVTIPYPDIYPPQPPVQLICLPETGLVRLRWSAVAGAAEYRVFRKRKGGRWHHLDFHVKTHEYTDRRPPQGTLIYAVRAVDAAGNESKPVACTTIAGQGP
ncbi:MAG: hypothetical protein GXP48_09830 [Acidobacteria bacterium]|nr:hypothetical protein [Acidobacteriota bacterium]